VEDNNKNISYVFIISEQKNGTVVKDSAYGSMIKYRDGSDEVVEFFLKDDFIISYEIGFEGLEEQ
jgi:hypothetical protein